MKTKKIFLAFVLNLVFITTFAQGENDNWYFGNQAAVNFSNPTTPISLSNSQMNTSEASGTASDANGNLLFYCNSQTIWNRLHQPMLNGTGLSGGDSSQQLAIVKNPANINQFYVFVTPEVENLTIPNAPPQWISYSIVDMSLGPIVGGLPLGAVLQNFKNIPILDNLGNTFRSEAVTVVAGSTADTYRLLIPSGNNLFSYRIDNTGFSGVPITSNLNFPGNLVSPAGYSIKASPKLNNQNFSHYICVSLWQDSVNPNSTLQLVNRVVSFNSSTGLITNNYSLNVNSTRSYLPEFNTNGSVLFLANTSIFAVDLLNSSTGNVNSLQIFNGPTTPLSASYTNLQRNKYGNIYINRFGSNFLGIINNPEIYGSNMSVTMNSVNLGNGISRYGLPQLITENRSTYYPCIDSLTLTSEPNTNFNYVVGDNITTLDTYTVGAGYNISMQAGQTINLLPDTHIQLRANYHAFIARCTEGSTTSKIFKDNQNQKEMVLNLDMEERKTLDKQIDIYPNPTSTYINIDFGNEKIISWELFDMSGKSILKGTSNQVNVQSLPRATYLLKINTKNKQVTKKVLVK